MRQVKRRDPAPSRIKYRLERMWLTPGYRKVLRSGLPIVLCVGVLGSFLSDPERQVAILNTYNDLRRAVEERPEFMVRMLAVDGATPALATEVRAMVPHDFPLSSFDMDLEAIRGQVETLDAVADARVRVGPGGVLQIQIEERLPALVWRLPEGLWLIDKTGHPVAPIESRSERFDLPLVAGIGADDAAPEALALMKASEPLRDRLRGFVRMGERRWDVVLDRDQRILLPEENPVAALRRVIALDQAQDMLARDVRVVDTRNPRRWALRLADDAIGAMRRIRALEETGSQE